MNNKLHFNSREPNATQTLAHRGMRSETSPTHGESEAHCTYSQPKFYHRRTDWKVFPLQVFWSGTLANLKPSKTTPGSWAMLGIFNKFSGELTSFLFCLAIFAQLQTRSPRMSVPQTQLYVLIWNIPYNRGNLNIPRYFIRNIPNLELGLQEAEGNKCSFLSSPLGRAG